MRRPHSGQELNATPVAIGTAAAQAGVNVQTLRYYERRGLIARPPRSVSGYRQYGPETIATILGIKRAQRLGFTLAEIHELLGLRSRRSPDRVRAVTVGKIRDVDERLRALRRMRRSLQTVLDTCNCGGDLTRCLVLDGAAADDQAPATARVKRRRTEGE